MDMIQSLISTRLMFDPCRASPADTAPGSGMQLNCTGQSTSPLRQSQLAPTIGRMACGCPLPFCCCCCCCCWSCCANGGLENAVTAKKSRMTKSYRIKDFKHIIGKCGMQQCKLSNVDALTQCTQHRFRELLCNKNKKYVIISNGW